MTHKPYPYETATPKQKKIGSLWWCIHHNAGKLEILVEPIENRVEFIREIKPRCEIETRLRAMRPVVSPLPEQLDKARAELDKARAEQGKAWAECDTAWAEWYKARAEQGKAWAEWEKARAEHREAIDAAFAADCPDVKWGPDGLVFPGADE